MNETPPPAIGQIWADNDPRVPGRFLRIVAVDETHAVVELHKPRTSASRIRPGRRTCTRIRLDRFRPTNTGYRYVSG